jgi:class 3 adenylate cyclase/predicted ATPase
LTVLFCDLVGSTALATKLDPEELRELIRAYQRVCGEVIERFEGHVAQYLGDGLLVYFGYPQSHEDDSERAVRAALGMVQAMALLNQELEQGRGIRLAMRIGIHTGLVVVGAMGGGDRQEQLALGDTPNVAARLQRLASPDTIVISGATQRLIQGVFACQDVGTHTLDGVPAPVNVFHVLREHDAQSRLDIAVSAGFTPLVGREQEVALLLERWAKVKEGQGQVVLVSGEPGIGKSRLVQVLRERVSGEQPILAEWHGSPYHTQSPLYPVITQLQRRLGWRQEDSPHERLRKLEAAVDERGLVLPEAVPLLASLLSLPLPERYPAHPMEPQQQKHRTLEVLLAWQLREAEQRPVVLIVEDVQWLDPSTLDFLTVLVDQAATLRLFTLLTCRSTFLPPWTRHTHLTSLTLARLPRQQAALMIERVTGSKVLPVEVREHLLATTDGVPLFIEELTKMILESGLLRSLDDRYELTGPLPTSIPATLHDSLITRLDRLPAAKPIAQLGATIGRQFSFELLQAVSPVDDATLERALALLVDAELLYQRGLPPWATYTFKHSLIQRAAYQSLLKSTRQQYHHRIAQMLVERFSEIVETQPELLAHHYTEAGLAVQAVPYWQRAGQRAIERSANLEAISHLTKGLEALKTLPETPEHTQQELMLQLAVGAPLLMIRGYPAPEVEHAYARALELCQERGDSVQLFSALSGLWGLYLTRPRLSRARDLAEQAFTLAQRVADQALLQQAHLMLGASLFYMGELVSAREHLEEAIALSQPPGERSWVLRLGADPGARCLAWAAWTLWILGYPDRALARMEEALSVAEQMSHAFTRAWVLHFAATLHSWRRELPLAQERAELEIALSTEQGFVRWLAGGMVRRGWALAMGEAPEDGIAQLSQGVATWRAMAGELGLTSILAQQAEAYGKGGRIKEGLSVLAEALALAERNAEHYYEAELHRLKGELLLHAVVQGFEDHPHQLPPVPSTLQTEEAEACFRLALDIARRRHAKMPELRAALSLGRLWETQGKRVEARQLLAEIYGWFTEGFDTRDLQDVRTLLQVLS